MSTCLLLLGILAPSVAGYSCPYKIINARRMSYIALLLLHGLLVTSVLGDNCPYKECLCAGTTIMCDDNGFEAIPPRLFNNNPINNYLDIARNRIATIPAGSLPANLSGISMQSNPIETIDDTAFDESIYTLQKLYFSQARFTQIPEAVFHLKALKTLDISETNILVWDDNAMKQFVATLQTLNLHEIGLRTWPTWIKSMTNLTQLYITGGSISLIPDDALDMMADTLTTLDLSNNSLAILPKSLSNMTALSMLSLGHNLITAVPLLLRLGHLYTLSLNNNKISDAKQLASALKPHADKLYSFDIHDNLLTTFPELSFMSRITTLDFTFNHISDSISGSAPSHLLEFKMDNNFLTSIPHVLDNLKLVHELNLNTNIIRTLKGNEFPNLIEIVNLNSNLISQLSRSSFPENSSIQFLNLNNNPIFSISSDAFYNVPLLEQLNIKNTKLTRLPLAILSLNKLRFLDVSGNINLVCTCQEQILQAKIQEFDPRNIEGSCGLSSVYFFFTELSPACLPLADL